MKARLILLLITSALLLQSCTTIKNEIIRNKLGLTRAELEELKTTADPDVVLSDGSAMMVWVMNKYAGDNGTFAFETDPPIKGDRKVESVSLTSSTLWISYPKDYNGEDILPVIFFTHGGAYTSSSYTTYQTLLGIFADRTNCIVFTDDYSLAPEHKYPSAVNDVWEAYLFLLEHGEEYNADSTRTVLMGDSAGGNFAAGLAIRAKEENVLQPLGVVLFYPSLSVYPVLLPSHLLFGGFDGRMTMIGRSVMENTIMGYLENIEDGLKPYASPLLMLQGALDTLNVPNQYAECAVVTDEDGTYVLPDHLIIVPEADSLRDEGVSYHASLTALGTNSKLSVYKGAVHGFLQLYQILDDGWKGIKEASEFIKSRVSAL